MDCIGKKTLLLKRLFEKSAGVVLFTVSHQFY